MEITDFTENWRETISSLKAHIDSLEREIPILLASRPSDDKESELFDIKVRAMQSRLKRALKDIQNSTQPFNLIKHEK